MALSVKLKAHHVGIAWPQHGHGYYTGGVPMWLATLMMLTAFLHYSVITVNNCLKKIKAKLLLVFFLKNLDD